MQPRSLDFRRWSYEGTCSFRSSYGVQVVDLFFFPFLLHPHAYHVCDSSALTLCQSRGTLRQSYLFCIVSMRRHYTCTLHETLNVFYLTLDEFKQSHSSNTAPRLAISAPNRPMRSTFTYSSSRQLHRMRSYRILRLLTRPSPVSIHVFILYTRLHKPRSFSVVAVGEGCWSGTYVFGARLNGGPLDLDQFLAV